MANSKAIDLGKLQEHLEQARKQARASSRALERAQQADDAARGQLAQAEAALANGFRTVKG